MLNEEFLAKATSILDHHEVVAVCGTLLDRFHDEKGHFTGKTFLRFGTRPEGPVRSTGGVIIISANARRLGLHYDETLDRNEDTDFSLRLSRSGPIIFIKTVMGEHLTTQYYKGGPGRRWFIEQHQRSIGELVTRHLNLPELVQIARLESGVLVGGSLMVTSAIAAIFAMLGWLIPLLGVALLWFADIARYSMRKGLADYLHVRILSPMFAIAGLFHGRERPRYSVTRIL